MHDFGNPRYTNAMIACYDFDRVFPAIPVKNCIMGMLLTCPISKNINFTLVLTHQNNFTTTQTRL